VVKILQGSVVTQTMLGGLTIHPPVAYFLQCTCAKNYENWLRVDKVIAQISMLTFLAHPVYTYPMIIITSEVLLLLMRTCWLCPASSWDPLNV